MGDSVQFGSSLPGMQPTPEMGGATFSESLNKLRNASLPARVHSAPPGTLKHGLLDRISSSSVLGKIVAIFTPNTETAAAVINHSRPQSMQAVKNGVSNSILAEAPQPPATKPVEKIKQAGQEMLAAILKEVNLRDAARRGDLEGVKKLLEDPSLSVAAKKGAYKEASNRDVANEIAKSLPAPARPLPTKPLPAEPPPIPSRANRPQRSTPELNKNPLSNFVRHNLVPVMENGVLANKPVEAKLLAQGITALFGGVDAYSDMKAALASFVTMMKAQPPPPLESQKRMLDIVRELFSTHQFDTFLRVQASDKTSELHQLLAAAKERPDLATEYTHVEREIQKLQQKSAKQFLPTENRTELDATLKTIRKGTNLDLLAANFASDSRDYFASLYANCDATEVKSNGPQFSRIVMAWNSLAFSATMGILNGKTAKERANAFQFYAQAARKAVDGGDLATAHALYAALDSPVVARLHIQDSKKQDIDIADLKELCSPTKNFKNLQAASNAKDVVLPSPIMLPKFLIGSDEVPAKAKDAAGKVEIPNFQRVVVAANIFKVFEKIAKVPIQACDKFPGFRAQHAELKAGETIAELQNKRDKEANARSVAIQPRK